MILSELFVTRKLATVLSNPLTNRNASHARSGYSVEIIKRGGIEYGDDKKG
jgi:hypothetical protein